MTDLDQAASTLADACRMPLDPDLPEIELRERVYAAIGHDKLPQALNDVGGLVRPPDDVFYAELAARKSTLTRFLPALLRVIQFDALSNAQGHPCLRKKTRERRGSHTNKGNLSHKKHNKYLSLRQQS